jgi:hypothetical protein
MNNKQNPENFEKTYEEKEERNSQTIVPAMALTDLSLVLAKSLNLHCLVFNALALDGHGVPGRVFRLLFCFWCFQDLSIFSLFRIFCCH